MRKILIIGASSAIAEAAARIWAQTGDSLYLVARNSQKLEMIAADLEVRGATTVTIHAQDINDYTAHNSLLDAAEQAMQGLDTVLIAHGSLSDQTACEQSVTTMLEEIGINALSVLSLLTLIANRFEAKKTGSILVISSVAGDRGRQSNYVYGSAKALVTTFTSGLRQRLKKSGIDVITIKPGFVDTPMTKDFKKGPLWATPEQVAKDIVKACNSGANIVYTPWFWQWIMLIIKLIPEFVFQKLKL